MRLWLLVALLLSIWWSTQWQLQRIEGFLQLLTGVQLNPLPIAEGAKLGILELVPLVSLSVPPKVDIPHNAEPARLHHWSLLASRNLAWSLFPPVLWVHCETHMNPHVFPLAAIFPSLIMIHLSNGAVTLALYSSSLMILYPHALCCILFSYSLVFGSW
jgi:hypothetical protein